MIAADFYVRQLTQIEIILEAGGNALTVLRGLKLGDREPLDIVATPMSLLLDECRRRIWAEGDEPERPLLPPLGDHDERTAAGEHCSYTSSRDGDYQAWVGRQADKRAVDREAQRLWEEKARAEAEAWARRESKGSDEGKAEGD